MRDDLDNDATAKKISGMLYATDVKVTELDDLIGKADKRTHNLSTSERLEAS